MNTRSSTELLDVLDSRAAENRSIVQRLRQLSDEELNRRPHPKAWTALEALEHLNIWSCDYLLRVEAALGSTSTRATPEFRSTWIGNQFAAGMKPGAKARKVPTLKKLNPRRQSRSLDRSVVATWLANAERQRQLLSAARSVDLNRVKIKTVLTVLLSMRLGDTLRMMVYHDWRHVEQAERATRGLAGIRTE